ncbi:Methyltransferase type 12 [Bacteroides coprosuis DSM 18011]|uniref:Methyltransferase type 12 n=1 Tax=Bacteroides coprosuis DSM 18011 TaxID=679937 RepID=F3ZV08_9BACE|nr:class I SAM-dependent methyltransferase [Bacteroides coprosuis]EGJ72466.1 Methyltransferase type 12 [Bacteroides coprosuis DSM 18011]
MNKQTFDQYAEKYDSWFLENKNVLYSEVKLIAKVLENSGEIFSVGCGSGLFEKILRDEFNINVKYGLEPSTDMAGIAQKRGLEIEINTAEKATYQGKKYDTIIYNGSPSYIKDLDQALKRSFDALKPGGKIILVDVPKESSYGMMYNLAYSVGSWNHELTEGVYPRNPYPIELVKGANWRTTSEKIEALTQAGFINLQSAQTLTKHPVYSDNSIEEPIEGYDCGDYVAVYGFKKE